ncbi:hypothetical protein AB9F43_22670 [Rhizobium leguminosarum]|uniref:hypothetical protein n=1 Tax=Rhizobium leguminosarum TaxID=384 RepID=UPI003F9852AC
MNRRDLLIASATVAIGVGAKSTLAQTMSIPSSDIQTTFSNDGLIENMLLSVATLRLILALARTDDTSAPRQLDQSQDAYSSFVNRLRGNRSAVLAAAQASNGPIVFSDRLVRGLNAVMNNLDQAGVARDSMLFNNMISALKLFLSSASLAGENVEGWFCGTFPFSAFCS